MLQPKVGDIVVVQLEVEVIRLLCDNYFTYDDISTPINCNDITEIKPAPLKVGDTVWWVADGVYSAAPYHGATLLYIHYLDGRKYAVVAYQGDIPKSVWFKDLRRSHSECVD